MKIKALIKSLKEKVNRLEKGSLDAAEVRVMKDEAQELYEHLLLLHFKTMGAEGPSLVTDSETLTEEQSAREHVGKEGDGTASASAKKESPKPTEDTDEAKDEGRAEVAKEASGEKKEQRQGAKDAEPAQSAEPERPAFHFGAPTAEAAPNQISLIDSIEEIKRMEKSINDTFKDAETKTLSHKLKQTPISDLKAAIGINMRFQFTASLFNGDNQAFAETVERLNAFSSYIEADDFIQNSLKDRFDWHMKDPAVKQFLELVERRYL